MIHQEAATKFHGKRVNLIAVADGFSSKRRHR